MTQKSSAVTWAEGLRREIQRVVVGHEQTAHRLLIGLLTGGHVLLEGLPGLAKTLVVKTLASASVLSFQRIQFTPDLLPADLTGTLIYDPKKLEFVVHRGPVFANLVLADEINRAPAKVQSALLEAMQERGVTIGPETHTLPEPFLVLATQNPLEHEGTFPLPEAQLDRFLFKLKIGYPSREEELQMFKLSLAPKQVEVKPAVDAAGILAARTAVAGVHVDDAVLDYAQRVAAASRNPEAAKIRALQPLVRVGISPRAAVGWIGAARASAHLAGRAYVLPEDLVDLAPDTFRHRLMLTLDAEADRVSVDEVIGHLLDGVPAP